MLFFKTHLVLFAFIAVAALAFALIVTRPERPDVAQARGEVIAAQTAARAALRSADSLLHANAFLTKRADSARVELVREHERAAVVDAALKQAENELVLAPVPAECSTIVAKQQAVIVAANNVIRNRDNQLSDALAADSADRKRADDAETVLARLKATTATLDTATTHLVNKSKPGFLSKLRPSLILGTVVGVDENKKPAIVVGVGMGWRF